MASAMPGPRCALRVSAGEFLETLGIAEPYLDHEHDRCYCAACYDGPDVIDNEGPEPYVVPRGWYRFGVELPKRAQDPKQKFFETWGASFHGVKSTNVLESILTAQELQKPGDTLIDGTVLESTKCAGRQDKVFYTSPTVRYAGLKFYAEPQRWRGDTMRASIAMQCRQKPGSFRQQGQTMGFTPQGLREHRPHVEPRAVEWTSKVIDAAVPYGLLVRV